MTACCFILNSYHDDVFKWKHFPRYWPFVRWPVTGEFASQKPLTRSFDVIFDLRLNIQLSKRLRGWWFETPSRSLWLHCYDIVRSMLCMVTTWTAFLCNYDEEELNISAACTCFTLDVSVAEVGIFQRHLLLNGVTFPAWIINHIHYKLSDEVIYLFPNLNGETVEVWEKISHFVPHFIIHVITFPCLD